MKHLIQYRDIIVAVLTLIVTLLGTQACQSVPDGWRIGLSGAIEAAVGCIDGDDPAESKRRRVVRCTRVILEEAGETIEAIEAPRSAAPSTAVQSRPPTRPPAPAPTSTPSQAVEPKETEAAPPSDPPAVPDGGAPGSTAWRARTEPPCKGWRYRYKRA